MKRLFHLTGNGFERTTMVAPHARLAELAKRVKSKLASRTTDIACRRWQEKRS